ncbi:brain-enriched guanylate kinase-associated protein-like isoform X2 [Scleropages formosus]|uniref:Si:dkey-174m14.3 n=1 Tax=Scleropages formosus TaxID=113540 RepID=A0A8C9U6T8_SCLFO|nr:brain-enriched guanylate kinase-associated protein-like isoform X2 [Scleropages formosus]XP_029108392.1 brain-enriched guanylate kinase-associated protein-like isoform X2 [Scleropages formosus]XP_029108393.1 brain-enriched guanylate kinase-associated protein-like isoform X2 [Scleropages formosus]XP_029108394.1 brain-enriched guanylate kinase-associated protein-like isoform X2 [Scleropages formosus]
MKKIYIGKTALKNSRNSGKHQKKSFLQEQKEDLRKRLSYTTHKLERLETEFDSTRQYLETELRRAQEELEKFIDKLRRIQSSYAALQRINQDLEDKIQRTSQHHDEEKRALSREIIVLNNHLIEAKMTIQKLREDNDLYRKDCNLAAQLLQCNKSHYRAHELSELPPEFQERVSLHMETTPRCHTPFSDSVPTSVIAKVLEKPEPGSSLASRSASPMPRDPDFLHSSPGSSEHLHLRMAYRSDMYSSDTALYCPDERHHERRQSVDLHGQEPNPFQAQNSTDSNPEEDGLHSSFSQEQFLEFAGSLPPSSSYSSFSGASDEKTHPPSSNLSSPQQALYMDWRDGNYEHKSTSPFEKESPGFPKSHSFQQMAHGYQNGNSPVHSQSSPVHMRAASTCFGEPFPPRRFPSSYSVGSYKLYEDGGSPKRSAVHVPIDELSGRWRQLSVEDLNAYSYPSPGRVSPYSFSEQHYAVRPGKVKLGPLYSSLQESGNIYSSVPDPDLGASSPSPEHDSALPQQEHVYRVKEDNLFHSGSTKDKESMAGSMKEYVDISPNSSTESLNQRSLEVAEMQHYQMERQSPSLAGKAVSQYQQFGTMGLSRKDSLTKAQLYGTLLN